jgi:CTP synthase (UTP-ammonia lyase)
MKISKAEYLKKAKSLTEDEQHRLLSRMTGKLPKRLSKEKLTVEEAIAIQLEIEDEQLQEWRKNWEKIKKQDATKTAKLVSKSPATTESKKTSAVKTVKVVSTKPAAKTSKTAVAKVAVSSADAPSKSPAAKPKVATASSNTGAGKVVKKPVSKPGVKPVAKKAPGTK